MYYQESSVFNPEIQMNVTIKNLFIQVFLIKYKLFNKLGQNRMIIE